ncbi:MAG: hypothetical protein ACREPD_14285 [Stenotrophomonas sp.]|uniref:hypothetical protein n=1 Tax=Stenotrophomonas sp. TaxID=69392 RepID=UPI003D6CF6DC
MSAEIDASTFDELFSGTTTLMASAPLRRELVLLRAALPPSAPEDWLVRPLYLEDALGLSGHIQQLLPPVPPDDVAWLRQTLAPLTRRQSRGVRNLIGAAYQTMREIPENPQLWLVPAVWSLRMEQLLLCQMFPASIRYWRRAWRSMPQA